MSMTKIPAAAFIKRLEHIQALCQSETEGNNERIGNLLSRLLRDIQIKPVVHAASDLTLEEIKNYLGLNFDEEVLRDKWYGTPAAPGDGVWDCKRDGETLSDRCFEKNLVSLRKSVTCRGEGAAKLIIDIFLLRARELVDIKLQPIVSGRESAAASSSPVSPSSPQISSTIISERQYPSTPGSSTSSRPSSSGPPSSSAPTSPGVPLSGLQSSSALPPSFGQLPSSSGLPSSSALTSTMPYRVSMSAGTHKKGASWPISRQTETPERRIPQCTVETPPRPTPGAPCNLKLWLEVPLRCKIGPTGDEIAGRADYLFGYSSNTSHSGPPPPETFVIVIEAKSYLVNATEALPQTLAYMGIIAKHRKEKEKTNQTVFGVCTTGDEWIFIRLDNWNKVTRSKLFCARSPEDQQDILWFLTKILHTAACSTPTSTPHTTPEAGQRVIEKFKDPKLAGRFGYGLDFEVYSMKPGDGDVIHLDYE